MTAIASLSSLINLATGGGSQAQQQVNWHKTALVGGAAPGTLVAGRMVDMWQYDGQPGSSTTTPSTAATMSSSSAGSWGQASASGGTDLFLLSVVVSSLQPGSVIIYDRLVQHGGLSGTTTTAQSTGTWPSLPRYTGGTGVELWAEIYTQIGATGTTITASYTNQAAVSGQTSVSTTFGGTGFREAQRVLPLPLASGDKGVTSVASMTVLATTGTAGNFGATLAYPLIVIPLPLAGTGRLWSGIMTAGGPLDLGTAVGSCLTEAFVPNGTTATALFGQAFFVEN